MDKTVAIIGGGIAGLSAAIHAIGAGWRPIVVEATANPGGRTRSFFAGDLGCQIDNGQHAFSPAYFETLRLLEILGTREAIQFPPRLAVNYYFRKKRTFHFQAANLSAPLHFLIPLLAKAPLEWREKLRLILAGRKIFAGRRDQLNSQTVRHWLYGDDEPDGTFDLLWQPLTLATLNTDANVACAALLHQVLHNAFLKSAAASALGLAQLPLSKIFADPAADFIKKHGGELLAPMRVKKFIVRNNRIELLNCSNSREITAGKFISAIPPYALQTILKDSGLLAKLSHDLGKFEYSPIITINLWSKKKLPIKSPAAFVGSPLQWLFELPFETGSSGFAYTLVISAADAWSGLSPAQIIEKTLSELAVFGRQPMSIERDIQQFKVIKEKRATFLQTPQAEILRPAARTSISNFYLAGDWTNTHLPATIESAALSGRIAIETLFG